MDVWGPSNIGLGWRAQTKLEVQQEGCSIEHNLVGDKAGRDVKD